MEGLTPKSVKKKMKQASFAAAVNREDITGGADEFGVELTSTSPSALKRCRGIADDLGLIPETEESR